MRSAHRKYTASKMSLLRSLRSSSSAGRSRYAHSITLDRCPYHGYHGLVTYQGRQADPFVPLGLKSCAGPRSMGRLRTARPQPGFTPLALNTAAASGVFR
jgi:hypothetical protein